MGNKVKIIIFILTILSVAVAYQNCSDVKLKSSAANSQALILLPGPIPVPPSACPAPNANDGVWSGGVVECMSNPIKEVNDVITEATRRAISSVELSKSYVQTLDPNNYYQLRGLVKSLNPNIAGTTECSYLGVLNNGASSSSSPTIYPVVYNRGSGYLAFRTGDTGEKYNITTDDGSPLFSNILGPNSVGGYGPWFITLTETPCDFNYSYIDDKDQRYVSKTLCGASTSKPGIYAGVGPGTAQSCELKANTIYYLNIRRENASVINLRGLAVSELPPFNAPLIKYE